MAHKHNRRRVRPRSRQHKKSEIDEPNLPWFDLESSTSLNGYSSDSSSSSGSSKSIATHLSLSSNTNSVSARHWQNRYVAWRNRDEAQRREAAKIEEQQLKLFGGEPGDDIDLCFKMMEVFEGMEWVDSMN